MSNITNKQMQANVKANLKDFEVAGVKTVKENLVVSFTAQARGRIVEWNSISGSATVELARVSAKDFGPQDFNVRNVGWVVHIVRRGKEVTRGMKPTPRKNAISNALTGVLYKAYTELDSGPASGPQRTGNDAEVRVAKQVAPKVARKAKVGKSLPKGVEALTIPEFLQRTVDLPVE